MIIVGHLVLTAALLAFGAVSEAAPIVLLASIIGLLMPFLNPIYPIIVADNAGPEWAATAAGVSNCIVQVAAILSPLVIGLAADARGDYVLTWMILATGALAGIIPAILLSRPER